MNCKIQLKRLVAPKLQKSAHTTVPRLLSASAIVLVFSAACVPRIYNDSSSQSATSKAVGSTTSASGPDYLEPLVDKSLLQNSVPPVNQPQDFSQDLGLKSPDNWYIGLVDDAGKIPGWGNLVTDNLTEFSAVLSSKWDVLAYENKLKKAGRKYPQPLAAASVLAILQKNRKEFSKNKEGGKPNTPTIIGMQSFFAAKPNTHEYLTLPDASRPFEKTLCQPYDPRNYSDIKWHYYCSIPGIFRACHRITVGTYFQKKLNELADQKLSNDKYLEQVIAAGKEDTRRVMTFCLGENKDLSLVDIKDFEDLMNSETAVGLDKGAYAKIFQAFYATQADPLGNKDSTGKVANMFDYIMNSQPYAFDFSQQQAVLNYYYGQMKPASQGAFNPKSSKDCEKYRDVRKELETGLDGKYCDAATARNAPFVSIGR